MTPVFQTKMGEGGNCFSACLASIFDLPIDAVPNFFETCGHEDTAWWKGVRDWLRPRGLGVIFLQLASPEHLKLFEGYLIVSGKSSRGLYHATIWRDGVMVHDPHPSGTGIAEPDGIDMLYPLLTTKAKP